MTLLFAGIAADIVDVGQQKLKIMEKLQKASSSDYGIISFTIDEYKDLVLENPRPYNVMTLFTVRTGCDGCDDVISEYKGVSYSFQQAETDTPTFFGVLYYTSDPKVREIFTTHNFKTVPYLATSKMQQKREDTEFYKEEDIWLVKVGDVAET